MLTVVVYAVISRLHADTKESLERRNAELQRSSRSAANSSYKSRKWSGRARSSSLVPKDIRKLLASMSPPR